MADLSQRASQLDTRLAEIDRKLRAIQVDLDPEREPSPSRALPDTPAAPEPVEAMPVPREPDDGAVPPASPVPPPPPASQPRAAPAPKPEPPAPSSNREPGRGRSGPLAALLQRSARQSAPVGTPPATPGSAETTAALPVSTPPASRPPTAPQPGMVPPEMHAKLLSAMRDLLDAYGWTLQQLPVAADLLRPGEPAPVSLSVGPFADTTAVRAFESELERIPGVRGVVLRGYEGENRAMFDVQVSAPNA